MEKRKIRRFEDLVVWQKARELANAVYALCETDPLSRDFGLRDQLRRAAVSVMSNIAEGFERETTPDFLHFLYIAKGSAGEIRSQLYLTRDRNLIGGNEFDSCSAIARENSVLLAKLIASLKEKQVKTAEEKKRRKKDSRTTGRSSSPEPPLPPSASFDDDLPFPFSSKPDPLDL